MDANALVLFTDARGFTRWANSPEVFARLDRFTAEFGKALHKAFPKNRHYHKPLGDGAMIVRELENELDEKETVALLAEALASIQKANAEFAAVCSAFGQSIGHRAELLLGWGVVRGPVHQLSSPRDYVGPNVNKGARLCGIARPYGIVIDRDDFPELPAQRDVKLFPQVRKLAGIDEDVRVWVTEEIASGFLPREKLKQVPEVHVAGQCIDPSSKRSLKVLIARRAPGRRLYPGKYEGCGGQLAASETFAEGVRRHFRLEMGLDVRVLEDLHCFYEIREPGEPVVPGIRFLCEWAGGEGPRSDNHTDLVWVTEKELRAFPDEQFVPGLKGQVLGLLEQYKRRT